jgi:hypothetical protein
MVKKLALFAALAAIAVGCSGPGSGTADESAKPPPLMSGEMNRGHGYQRDVGLSNADDSAIRQQIRGASLEMRVSKLDDAEKKISTAIKDDGGFEQSLNSTDLASANATLSIHAKVPVEKMDDVISRIEGLGTRLAKSISMEDVTADIFAYQSQIDAAQKQLDQLLEKKNKTDYDKEQITNIRQQLASITTQRNQRQQSATFATLDLTVRQGAVPISNGDPNWLTQAYGESSSGFASAFRVLVTGLMWVVFMSPFYLPLIVLIWLVSRTQKRKRLQVPAHAAPPAM